MTNDQKVLRVLGVIVSTKTLERHMKDKGVLTQETQLIIYSESLNRIREIVTE